jgi:D-alanyl-D-alanine carboxypeptidase
VAGGFGIHAGAGGHGMRATSHEPLGVLLALAAVACAAPMDERQPDRSARLRSYLDALVSRSKTPGIQYHVVDSARTLFEYDGGWADIRHRVPMDSATTMMAYSMSKTLTAVAVLQLVDAHKVALDDPIDRYVDSIPYDAPITVRELLSHTGGVPNPIPLRWVHLVARHETFDERAALAAELRAHPRLAFPPGTRYAYSNLGYWLLGRVVERASGETFPAYVNEHVLRRLGASPRELGYVIPDLSHHARGYLEKYSFMNLAKGFLIDRAFVGDYEGSWLRIEDHYPNGAAFGGLVGTARGFGKFLQDQLRAHSVLFGDATRSLLYAPQRTRDGTPVAMTLGWHTGELAGVPFFYKEGGGGGFHHLMRVYPASGVATVVMTNATGFDVKQCLNRLDAQFVLPPTPEALAGRR